MSEQLQRLHLFDGKIRFPQSPDRRLGLVMRDVQYIHHASHFRIGTTIQRLTTMDGFGLSNKGSNTERANALFEAEVSRDDEREEVTVVVPNTDLPSQAAGWAALQLYREKLVGDTLPGFMATDPLEKSGKRAAQKRLATKKRSKATETSLHGSALAIQNAYSGEGTNIFVNNESNRSLPGLLSVIQDGYGELYPEIESPVVSTAVAGIVGANNVEDFTGAWNEAATYDNPVKAARNLLESGVFAL